MSRKAGAFLDLAATDLAHAKANLRAFPRHAAFTLQQAAEKIIKAVLSAESVPFLGTSHQLEDLVGRIPEKNPFRADLLALGHLTSAATRYRYPTPRGDVPEDPPAAEMVEDLEALELLLPEVRAWLREGK
ncbi:MAG: HEPN domain-containing protein [Stellaceae bacterium]